MARKASMLDIFQMSDKRQKATQTKGASRGNSRGKSGRGAGRRNSGRRGSGDAAVALSSRHLVYAGSIVVLLVALSFVLGIAAGSGGTDDDGRALSRTSPTQRSLYVKGSLTKTSWTDHQPVNLGRVVGELFRRYDVARDDLQVLENDTTYFLFVGSFGSRADARRYIEDHGLDTFDAGGGQFPFNHLEIVDGLE